MAKTVNHAQRRRDIVTTAVRMFSQVGYENVSLIMISAAAAVSRTALYRYFKSKREVMDAAILSVTDQIAAECTALLTNRATTAQKLEGVCHTVVDVMFANKDFLVAVFDFVIGMVRAQENMGPEIGRFTQATRRIIARLLKQGMARGEFPSSLNAEHAADVLYSEFESSAMRIVLGTERNARSARLRFSTIVHTISVKNGK